MRMCSRVDGVDHTDDRVVLHTDGVEVLVMYPTDDIVRIRAGFDPGFVEESYTLAMTAWPDRLDPVMAAHRTRVEPAPVAVEETPHRITVRGARLRVEVDREPFRIRVLDEHDRVLHTDLPHLGLHEDNNGRRIHCSEIIPGDHFYGFGEKTGPWDKSRQLMTMSPRDSLGYDAADSDPLYKHIPFYVKANSATGVATGYFYHNTYDCDFDMGRQHSNYWPHHSRYRADGGDIDLFLIAGPSIREVVQRYTDLTGKPTMLPKTALGYLGSSMYYPELPKDCDEAIVQFIDTTRRHDIPIDGFHLSSGYTHQESDGGSKRCVFTWNDDRFPDPAGFIEQMSSRGITVTPNVKPGVLLSHPDVEEMREAGIFVRDGSGDEDAVGAWWGGPGHFVDFTDPRARQWWKQRLTRSLLDLGITSIWNDNCEYDGLVDLDSRCHFDQDVPGEDPAGGADEPGRGATIARLKSVMANLMCQVTTEAIHAAHPRTRPYIVCRAGHAGIQRYAQTWSGDNTTSWRTLEHNIATMLGMGLSGVPHQGSDVCGFHGPSPDPELMVRWIQHGVFQPRFSIHSVNSDNTVTEPWMYSGHTDLVRDAIRLRYRLFPYLYALTYRAHRTGLPIMEPMCSAFQDDPACYGEGVDFMLGDALLVANVVRPGQRERSVYLPVGERFYDLATRQAYEGGQTITVPVDLATIPVFLRGGAILPLATHQMDNLATQHPEGLRLVCAPDRDGEIVLYEDDGLTRDYEDGHFRTTRVTMSTGQAADPDGAGTGADGAGTGADGNRVCLDFRHEGSYPTRLERMELDVVHREGAPLSVHLDEVELPHFLDRQAYEQAERGWYYSQTLKSVQVSYPPPPGDHAVTLSFDSFDMIGM